MATCKDCLHEKVCDALIKSGCPYLDEEIPADAFCMVFKNKADVAPRAEVAREIFLKIDYITRRYMDDRNYSTGEMLYDLDELKKKYTEGE